MLRSIQVGSEKVYPFVLVDAMVIKTRSDDRVVSRAALIVSGIRSDGYRDILGIKLGDTESFATWEETFRWLKGRGLKGVMFLISDQHGGLVEAAAKHFQGASWQRCQVHLMRNILGHCSPRVRAEVAAAAKLVFQAADMTEARRRLKEFVERFQTSAAKATQRSFRPLFVVFTPPSLDHNSGMRQADEPVFVQALIAQSAVKRFDIGVLVGLARLDQEQPYTTTMRPRQHRPAAELLAVVGADRLR